MKAVMEHTGRQYKPIALYFISAGIFVSAVNPKLIKDYGNNSLRIIKTDKADAKKMRGKYNFSSSKAAQIYAGAQERIALLPKDSLTKMIIQQSVDSLSAASKSVGQLKAGMLKLSEQLPAYSDVMDMDGAGNALDPNHGRDWGRDSICSQKRCYGFCRGCSGRETVWQICGKKELPQVQMRVAGVAQNTVPSMTSLLKNKPQDNPVYLFMNKKLTEGKPYLVYTADANKFLRIYYGKMREYLTSLE